jgi:hypothetical protein
MKRLPFVLVFLLAWAMGPGALEARADVSPYQSVVDKVDPAIDGLTVRGGDGPCDLIVVNKTAADVLLFDEAKHPVTIRAYKPPVGPPNASLPPAPGELVRMVEGWPCSHMPTVSEDQRWNEVDSTLLLWSISGSAAQKPFFVRGHTVYHAAADPVTIGYRVMRYGTALLLVGTLLFAMPYLADQRRKIFGKRQA